MSKQFKQGISKERKLKALQEGQFYFFANLKRVINDLVEVCQSLRRSASCIQALILQGELSLESINKMVVTCEYLEARIQDDMNKLVQFMRHMIIMFDQVMIVMEDNIRQEFLAVKEMMKKVVEPHCSLSQSTMSLVWRKAKLARERQGSFDSSV